MVNDVSFEEAMSALNAIEVNLSSGLLPTTGGAISLLNRAELDVLCDGNLGKNPKFTPVVPDSGERASSRDEWYVAALEQALFHGSHPFSPAYVPVMDGLLHGYHGSLGWERIHRYAVSLDETVLPFGTLPYWTPVGEPLSVLAFLGADRRASVADNAVPELLGLMLGDQDPGVRSAVEAADSRRGNASSAASAERLKQPVPLSDPEVRLKPPLPASGSYGGSYTYTESAAKSPAQPKSPPPLRWVAPLISSAVTAGALIALFAAFISVGLGNGYTYTVVDQAARPATTHTESNAFNISGSGTRLCSTGDDYLACVNMHVAMYNSVCFGQPLTATASSSCDSLHSWIEEAKSKYSDCGYGCTAGEGEWGWEWQRLTPVQTQVSNKDARREITHTEECVFEFGGIKLGTCPDDRGGEDAAGESS